MDAKRLEDLKREAAEALSSVSMVRTFDAHAAQAARHLVKVLEALDGMKADTASQVQEVHAALASIAPDVDAIYDAVPAGADDAKKAAAAWQRIAVRMHAAGVVGYHVAAAQAEQRAREDAAMGAGVSTYAKAKTQHPPEETKSPARDAVPSFLRSTVERIVSEVAREAATEANAIKDACEIPTHAAAIQSALAQGEANGAAKVWQRLTADVQQKPTCEGCEGRSYLHDVECGNAKRCPHDNVGCGVTRVCVRCKGEAEKLAQQADVAKAPEKPAIQTHTVVWTGDGIRVLSNGMAQMLNHTAGEWWPYEAHGDRHVKQLAKALAERHASVPSGKEPK